MNEELRLLRQATLMNLWRWRSEVKRLAARGSATPFLVHLRDVQGLHKVWRELRKQAGLPSEPPARVERIALRLTALKCKAYLRSSAT